jgi:dTDP-4-dehydrorhamnose 3,5-epimerase
MKILETPIKDLIVLEPLVHADERGYFYESFNANTLKPLGINTNFVQDNQSKSVYGILRGLHYQCGEHAQSKLVRVLSGTVLDVAVDIRKDSPTYGQHYSVLLSGENKKQMYIPRGFAHGFVVLSETAEFFYKCDNFYNKDSEGGILWNDTDLNIDWQVDLTKVAISGKDAELPMFKDSRSIGL